MSNKGMSKEQREKAKRSLEALKESRRKLAALGGNTAANRQRRMEKNAKRLREHARRREANESATHDGERRKLRALWRQEARKTTEGGWTPSWPVWLALYKASQENDDGQ